MCILKHIKIMIYFVFYRFHYVFRFKDSTVTLEEITNPDFLIQKL